MDDTPDARLLGSMGTAAKVALDNAVAEAVGKDGPCSVPGPLDVTPSQIEAFERKTNTGFNDVRFAFTSERRADGLHVTVEKHQI